MLIAFSSARSAAPSPGFVRSLYPDLLRLQNIQLCGQPWLHAKIGQLPTNLPASSTVSFVSAVANQLQPTRNNRSQRRHQRHITVCRDLRRQQFRA